VHLTGVNGTRVAILAERLLSTFTSEGVTVIAYAEIGAFTNLVNIHALAVYTGVSRAGIPVVTVQRPKKALTSLLVAGRGIARVVTFALGCMDRPNLRIAIVHSA